MRYPILTGLLICGVAGVAATVSIHKVEGQTAAPAGVTVAPGTQPKTTYYVLGQPGQPADEQNDEMAKLSSQDAQLAGEADSLVKQLADATDEKLRAEIKEKLRTTLGQQFDAQQKVRELEVARIEAKVKKLRDTISKRNEARRTIVEKRFDQLISEAEGLGWNSPPAGGPSYGAVYMVPQTSSAGQPSYGNNKPLPRSATFPAVRQ